MSRKKDERQQQSSIGKQNLIMEIETDGGICKFADEVGSGAHNKNSQNKGIAASAKYV